MMHLFAILSHVFEECEVNATTERRKTIITLSNVLVYTAEHEWILIAKCDFLASYCIIHFVAVPGVFQYYTFLNW